MKAFSANIKTYAVLGVHIASVIEKNPDDVCVTVERSDM